MRVGNIRVLCAVWGRLLFCEVSYASTILANYKASKMVDRRGGGLFMTKAYFEAILCLITAISCNLLYDIIAYFNSSHVVKPFHTYK